MCVYVQDHFMAVIQSGGNAVPFELGLASVYQLKAEKLMREEYSKCSVL